MATRMGSGYPRMNTDARADSQFQIGVHLRSSAVSRPLRVFVAYLGNRVPSSVCFCRHRSRSGGPLSSSRSGHEDTHCQTGAVEAKTEFLKPPIHADQRRWTSRVRDHICVYLRSSAVSRFLPAFVASTSESVESSCDYAPSSSSAPGLGLPMRISRTVPASVMSSQASPRYSTQA